MAPVNSRRNVTKKGFNRYVNLYNYHKTQDPNAKNFPTTCTDADTTPS
jgi:hypothetical protein